MEQKHSKKKNPENSKVALLLIDVINDLQFPEADKFLPHGLEAAKNIATLKRHFKKLNLPIIYVNDNFGVWRSDFLSVVEHCTSKRSKGSEISKMLTPQKTDYFVLKPKHSGFYSTTLEVLLDFLNVKQIVMCGFAGNMCVLFTANDAYMREFKLYVPSDCIASNSVEENQFALRQMKQLLKADIRSSAELKQEKIPLKFALELPS